MAGAAKRRVVSHTETLYIQGLLRYLHYNYSRKINTNDALLIAAISALLHVESGSFKGIRFNNPFNLKSKDTSRVVVDEETGKKRTVRVPGKLLRFATLAKGFEAMAKVLMNAPKGSELNLALNALKRGGNQAAVDFLAAIAMSTFQADHYGATDWMQAYDQNHNALIREYLTIGGVQLKNPYVRPKKPPPPPPSLPRDFNYKAVVREYLDPWAAGSLYASRHRRATLDSPLSRR